MVKAHTTAGKPKAIVKETVHEMEGRKARLSSFPTAAANKSRSRNCSAAATSALLLSQGPDARMHGRGVRLPRHRGPAQDGRRAGRRRQRGLAGLASQVHRQAHAQLSAPERRRQPSHAALRGLQEEVALWTRIHGNRAHHLRHRSRGHNSQGPPQGQGRRPRRRRGRGAEGAALEVRADATLCSRRNGQDEFVGQQQPKKIAYSTVSSKYLTLA